MTKEIQLVRRYELEYFLWKKMGMSRRGAKNEASNLWSILIDSSDPSIGRIGAGLPLHLVCTVCGEVYGKCNDLFKYKNRYEGSYSIRQKANWAFELNSLLKARQIIMRVEVSYRLGPPEAKRVPRQRLQAWLDHLAQ